MSETKEYAPNTLSESLACRYPAVWVYSQDVVEVIDRVRAHVGQFSDLSLFMMDSLNGLQKYNYLRNRFDTVLIVGVNPMTGEEYQSPIYKIDEALDHVMADPSATLVLANVEQYENNLNDMMTFMNLAWRTGWRSNQQRDITAQLIMVSSTEPSPPSAVSRNVQSVVLGFPSKEELATITTHISEHMNATVDIPAVAQASRGLTVYEAASMYHSSIARRGTIDVKELEDVTFERIANRTNMAIVRPQIGMEDVAGMENIKKILETSQWLRANPEEAKNYGVSDSIHRFMLLGPPGVGKSYLCEAAASFLRLNLVRTGMSHMLSKFHGESENNMLAMFEQLNALDPICVWLDEFGRDASGGQSSHVVDGGSTSRVHGLFLTGMQELAPTTYLFAAANDISTLAPEMLRADRFDKIFFIGFPTLPQRHQILSGLLKERTHSVDIGKVAMASGSYTGAELKSVLAAASQVALGERRNVETDDMLAAMNRNKNRLWIRYRPAIIESYKVAYEQYEWASDDQYHEARAYMRGDIPRDNPAGTRRETITASSVNMR